MAQKSPVVKHAILALAATYVMDYKRSKQLMLRAHQHHLKAVYLFGIELHKAENYEPGNGDAFVAALMTFNHNEVVNWELDALKVAYPKWYLGAKLAERVLNASNPGFKYVSPRNVQSTRARIEMGNRVCLDTIPSACVFPLVPKKEKERYSWLMEGTEQEGKKMDYPWLSAGTDQEQRKIIGFTGLSSKLMHTFAKITRLCIKFSQV